MSIYRAMVWAVLGCLAGVGPAFSAAPAPRSAPPAVSPPPAPAFPYFAVRQYQVRGYALPAPAGLESVLAKFTGTNVSVAGIVEAAAALQAEYEKQGRTNVSVSVATTGITNGVLTLNVFRGGVPLILVGGRPYSRALPPEVAADKIRTAPKPTPGFWISAYEISGDTLLTMETLTAVLAKHTGTNLTVTNILQAAADLQLEYRNRGFPTVHVAVPPQQIGTNGLVKIRVFQGIVTDIEVIHNRYFSSNNVRRALPSLRTNAILVGPVFQAELDRANANKDRQISPQLEPGPDEGTSRLTLDVDDRLPLHGRVELNSQSSPGTPYLRVNSSAVYQNLWQLEHSAGVQYSFSPEGHKDGDQWNFYDLPLVANYSAFYKVLLGSGEPIAEQAANPLGHFGYDEATRKFQLPPSSGRAELNIYATRSTIDTGLNTISNSILTQTAAETVRHQIVQQDLTINDSVGFRLSQPLAETHGLQSLVSGGSDFKAYDFRSSKTNLFVFTTVIHDQNNNPVQTNTSVVPNAVPYTHRSLEYLPLTLRYDGSLPDARGTTRFGLGLGGNLWYSGSLSQLQAITSSTNSTGHWVTFNPSLYRDFYIWTNWVTSIRADGQWASEPLINNEQYALGGLNTIRGYHEGEVFGDTGWHVSGEQGTPPYVVGRVYGHNALSVRGIVYMDYGEDYLLEPQGRAGRTPLWGSGFGAFATVGSRWEARFLFSWPLLSAGITTAYSPRFDFSLSAQF